MRYKLGEWHQAEAHNTKGFAYRPGFHCTLQPQAPHLSKKDRAWLKVEIEDFEYFDRPQTQGGRWALAQKLKPLEQITLDN